MNAKFYDSELLIAIIRKNCNNPDDLSKIINACECLKELLQTTEQVSAPTLTVNQLLAKNDAEKLAE